jgi:hypothetical protein
MAIELIMCQTCGTRNSSDRLVCLSCGATLREGSHATQPGNGQNQLAGSEMEIEKLETKTIDWFKAGTLFALLLMAFSLFYHYVISSPKIEHASVEKTARVAITTANETRNDPPDTLTKQSISFTEEREKAARELAQAQADFERKVREDDTRAEARLNQEKQAREAYRREVSVRAALNQCWAHTYATYINNWNQTCAVQGRPQGCTLIAPVVANLEQNHKAARDECYRLYPPDTNYGR